MSGAHASSDSQKHLGRNTLVVLGGLIVFAIFALIILPPKREGTTEAPAPAVTPNAPLDQTGWLDPTAAPAVRGKKSPPVDLKAAVAGSPEMMARGKELFAANCVACHGAAGKGDGPAAVALNPRPRNFAEKDGWKNGYRITQVFTTLSKGIPGSAMAAFDTLAPTDRFALAHYVQSLGSFDHGADDAQAVAALDKAYSLSTGVQEPNRVPVSLAVNGLVKEYTAVPPVRLPAEGDPSEGAQLLRSAVLRPGRAARVLAGAKGWREDLNVLVKVVVAGSPDNGFSPSVATLDARQWALLQGELVKATPAG